MDKSALRNAATTILHRDIDGVPHVLMGQRGENAAFMPNKYVFPGGAVDQGDHDIPLCATVGGKCLERLQEGSPRNLSHALLVAGIRELWEETGLILGREGQWAGDIPPDWADFAARGFIPSAEGLSFVFRAITPPGRPRRFDARFFLVDAHHVHGNPSDFSAASDELSHLHWIAISNAKELDLPFITEVVLAEVSQVLRDGLPPKSVPFFKNNDEENLFLRLNS
ncbi:NUDIX hydrolase [Falsihalocynthiibacter arcticus]|uniref:DNA mismatch repair protein MutT n=1 Tax=Falsihalocynthiibacter arcticus TaxID=1579316 RepID=A0A126UZV2_9RHOB|nr:NUDIX hydrolase [Falsihalocynthiibacter arcticus]AML51598.1 DNA mismatch repair protein MutT [Falsihalocynthiibacter arcticus]